MPHSADTARFISLVEHGADDASDLADRMRDLGAWGAYAALTQLAREREARAERLHTRWLEAVTARSPVARLVG